MKVLLTTATNYEIAPTIQYLNEHFSKTNRFEYTNKQISVFPLCTEVGMMSTAYALGKFAQIQEVDMAIQVGVAGSFTKNLSLGQLVEVASEQTGDLGVEEADGSFTDVFELGLCEKDEFPYTNGIIHNKNPAFESGLQKVRGLTINKVHGTEQSVRQIQSKYNCDVESMEGAAFFYACRMQHLKFIQLRSISNYVEIRNKDHWDLEKAIHALNLYLVDWLKMQIQ